LLSESLHHPINDGDHGLEALRAFSQQDPVVTVQDFGNGQDGRFAGSLGHVKRSTRLPAVDANACLDSALGELFVRCREDCCDVYVEEEWGYDSSLGESVEEVKWL